MVYLKVYYTSFKTTGSENQIQKLGHGSDEYELVEI